MFEFVWGVKIKQTVKRKSKEIIVFQHFSFLFLCLWERELYYVLLCWAYLFISSLVFLGSIKVFKVCFFQDQNESRFEKCTTRTPRNSLFCLLFFFGDPKHFFLLLFIVSYLHQNAHEIFSFFFVIYKPISWCFSFGFKVLIDRKSMSLRSSDVRSKEFV